MKCYVIKIISFLVLLLIVSLPLVNAYGLNLVYDVNGNLLWDGDTYREYNSLNQLSAVYDGSDNVTLLVEYVYHPVEERVLKKTVYEAGVWKETIYYISESFVSKKNASGVFNETYVHLNGELVAQKLSDGETQFIITDHLGSSSVVTNSTGGVVERTSYDTLGNLLSGGSETRFDYESRETESFGSMDFRFRQYNPELGIFLQPDSLIQDVYDPQSLNRYMFERGNPYKYVDKDGHVFLTLAIVAVLGLIIYSGYKFGEQLNELESIRAGDGLTTKDYLWVTANILPMVAGPSLLSGSSAAKPAVQATFSEIVGVIGDNAVSYGITQLTKSYPERVRETYLTGQSIYKPENSYNYMTSSESNQAKKKSSFSKGFTLPSGYSFDQSILSSGFSSNSEGSPYLDGFNKQYYQKENACGCTYCSCALS